MKKQLLKIGCLLSVLFLFTSCVIDGDEIFVIKVDNGYEKKSELNEYIWGFEGMGYNMRIDTLRKGNWHILVRENIYDYFSSTSDPWVGIDKVYFPKNFIKNMELEGEIDAYTFFTLTPKKVKLPSSVTAIGNGAFRGCVNLEKIEIPSSVTAIGGGAFRNCENLEKIEIPSSVTEIDYFVFSGCSSLTSIKIDKANQVYDSRNNCNAIIRKNDNELIAGTSTTKIPSSVTAIGEGAFSRCVNLEKIELPSSVTAIGEGAFSGCVNLEKIELPSSVTKIGDELFRGCTSLTNVVIPSSVTVIGSGAFRDCENLEKIEIPSSVTEIGELSFYGCKNLKSVYLRTLTPPLYYYPFSDCPADFYVPMESVEAYKNAEGWSEYASRIVGY